jgi:hypothetical protein
MIFRAAYTRVLEKIYLWQRIQAFKKNQKKRNRATRFISKRGAQTKIMTKNSDKGGEKREGEISL